MISHNRASNKENFVNRSSNKISSHDSPFKPAGTIANPLSPNSSPLRTKYWYHNANRSKNSTNSRSQNVHFEGNPSNSTKFRQDFRRGEKDLNINNLHTYGVSDSFSAFDDKDDVGHHPRVDVDPASLGPAGLTSKQINQKAKITSNELITRGIEADKLG
jgi:hypothetical protein